ncbi:hypothetical protein CDAR_422911 [Caerostris darwini]|uniref:Uncharacterized protein n=1 Tax=Caerostris darwini TaxID=1538125 RepID=A0AAV4TFG5_9ARAC|nr:hypothetical protein CDAR_422911 [Caerostris darwini]
MEYSSMLALKKRSESPVKSLTNYGKSAATHLALFTLLFSAKVDFQQIIRLYSLVSAFNASRRKDVPIPVNSPKKTATNRKQRPVRHRVARKTVEPLPFGKPEPRV